MCTSPNTLCVNCLSIISFPDTECLYSLNICRRLHQVVRSLPVVLIHLSLTSPHLLIMALCSVPSSRFILHSANALVLVSVKVQEASKFPDIKIVSFDWLTTSIKGQIRADETQFSFDQTSSNPDDTTSSMGHSHSKQNDTKGKGTKRPRSPSPINDYSSGSDAEEAEEQPPVKRHKDVQRATSGSLIIPVDETCPLAGKDSPDCELVDVRAMAIDSDRHPSSVHRRGRHDLRCSLEPDKCRSQQQQVLSRPAFSVRGWRFPDMDSLG